MRKKGIIKTSFMDSRNSLCLDDLLSAALYASKKAGEAILDIYHSYTDYEVKEKEDKSPLTIADKKSDEIIKNYLTQNSISINGRPVPVLSEEGTDIPYEERKRWEYFWLIDPLDGTKEFIKRNDEFTVNIAVIHMNRPVMGVVYVPVKDVFYYATDEIGAFKLFRCDELKGDRMEDFLTKGSLDELYSKSIKLPIYPRSTAGRSLSTITVIASRSHINDETRTFIDNLKKEYKQVELISAGSSLKLCLVAEGKADIYPRLGPTMEWDTAAAHAVVNGSGKKVTVYDSNDELSYNKENLLNPYFIVK